ncbi:MAG: hypothetical protein ACYTFY_17040, partial [Planctomycetota bacterium]
MGITLWQSMSNNAKEMIDNAFCDIKTAEDWEKARPEIKHQFLHSMGLDNLPEKCDSKVTEYGEVKGEGFKARKIAYQLLPDCWGSAVIYYPDP